MSIRKFAEIIFLLAIYLVGSASALAENYLAAYNVNPNTVTVVDISSGGDMAVQLLTANSPSFHGAAVIAGAADHCAQNQQTIDTAFVHESGINEWADSSNILLLYRHTITSLVPYNPEGCWDWRGYTGSNYEVKSAAQMRAIMCFVRRITSGYR